MGCYHPMKGWIRQDVDGKRRFTMSTPRAGEDSFSQTVPCGQCVGCRLDRSRSWALRCMHEAQLYSANCFITLTYSPQHLPANGSLDYRHFQKFMKRLRKRFQGVDVVRTDDSTDRPIRYYVAGEYGSKLGRPHFHACLFNFDFSDKYYYMNSPSGEKLYRSPSLEEFWPFGFSSVGSVTFQSAAYVARYIMKKVTGQAAYNHYETVDEYGVVDYRTPEFNKMSLKPGIGARFYEKYKTDFFKIDDDGNVVQDFVVMRGGQKVSVPRYYSNIFKVESPFGWDAVQYERFLAAQARLDDNTTNRLKVKETIAISRLNRLKRSL
jgi:hypothetical protein